MRLFISEFTDSGIKSITITHRGETITWDARPYVRASRIEGTQHKPNPDNDIVFREINGFLDTLSGDRQERIWQCYLQIHELFELNYDPLAAQDRWQDVVGRIYQEVPYEELHQWVGLNGVVELPMTLKTKYDEKDPVDLTYLRQDYFDLAVMAIAARLMVPIWGEYIPRLKLGVSNNDKEYVAASLIYRTYLPVCAPYERLRRYMEASIQARGKPNIIASAIHDGLSSDSFPDWLLASTLVRRTSVVPIASNADGPNIITDVYQYVKNALMPSGSRRFSGPISDKKPRTDDKADQQESLAESYKIKQEVSDGDVQMAEVYLSEEPVGVAMAIDPTIDPEQVGVCVRTMDRLVNEPLNEQHHLTLTQWVLAPAVSMGYIPLITKPALLKAMAITQALLWHWGFFDLAALVAASEIHTDSDEFVSAQESRSDKLSREQTDALALIYPNARNERGKNVTFRQYNAGYVAVDAFHRLLAGRDWQLHVPDELLNQTSRIVGTRKMYVPVNLRSQTADLLIHLHANRLAFEERSQARLAGISSR